MKETLIKQWDNILNLLEIEYDVSHMMINTWIRALSIKEVTDTTITLAMDQKLGKRGIEFIEKKMYDIYLQSAIEATLNQPFEILFCVEGEAVPSYNKEEIRAFYEEAYKNEKFVRILPEGTCPETKWVEGSNYVDVNVVVDERTGRVIMMGAMDNLVKGAAGQAVQNMNLMFGLPEDMGLQLVPMFP